MSLYGKGNDEFGAQEDMFFVEEKTEVKQGGFQPMIDLKNKFAFVPVMEHYKASPKLMTIGTHVSYGISDNGELLAWTTEADARSADKNFNIDLKNLSQESRDGGVIGKAGRVGLYSQFA